MPCFTDYYLGTGTVLAVVLVLLLVLVVMLVGVVMYRRKRRKASGADRVSFENPSYLREMNLENLQVRAAPVDKSRLIEITLCVFTVTPPISITKGSLFC